MRREQALGVLEALIRLLRWRDRQEASADDPDGNAEDDPGDEAS